jgi:hypothetical protein
MKLDKDKDDSQILVIDPGTTGGWVVGGSLDDPEITLLVEPMPKSMALQVDRLRDIVSTYDIEHCYIEQGDLGRSSDHSNAAVEFARHYGWLEAALYVFGIPVSQVPVNVWQRDCGPLPKKRLARKRAIQKQMTRRFPVLKVTPRTADALAMFLWAAHNQR